MNMRQTKHCVRQRGFSLIEMLVVMFLIGIVTGMVVLSVDLVGDGSESDQFEDELDRLLALSVLAEDQSVLSGEPIGLILWPPETENYWRYSWQRYRDGQWVDVDEPLVGGRFPENIEISLEIEGELIEFPKIRDEDIPMLPSIVFYPGGEITPFILSLFNATGIDEQQLLTSQRNGRVEWLSEEEALEYL